MTERGIIRHATWLELFYDLVFVIVIANITHTLSKIGHTENSHIYFLKYILMFLPVWWAWIGHTLYNNRFDRGDKWQNMLTIVQIFAIIVMSVFVAPDFENHYLGFTISYVAIRYLLVLMYWRSCHLHPEVKSVSKYFMIGFFIGASISLSSIFFSGFLKYVVLYAGILFDFFVPILGKKRIQIASINSHHLPERLGLMTIILLGEGILSITNSLDIGMSNWEGRVIIMLGYIFILSIFWVYFSFIDKDIHGKPLRHGQELIYGHLPLYLALGLIPNIIYFSIPGYVIQEEDFLLLALGAMGLLLVSLQLIRLNYVKKMKNRQTALFLIMKLIFLYILLKMGLPKAVILAACTVVLLFTFILHHKNRVAPQSG